MSSYLNIFASTKKGGSSEENFDNFSVETVPWIEKAQSDAFEASISGKLLDAEIHFCAVADGVSCSPCGGQAARAAMQTMRATVRAWGAEDGEAVKETEGAVKAQEDEAQLCSLCEQMLEAANRAVCGLSESLGSPAATTVSLLLWENESFVTANIGDSPIYLLRNGKLRLLSEEHTLGWAKLLMDQKTKPADHQILFYYLGKPEITAGRMMAVTVGRFEPGDKILICSDGISKGLSERRIRKILTRKKGSNPAAFLSKKAAGKPGSDDSTAIVVEVKEV